ncbi:MAG: PAS domain-containing protein, partial [Rhodoferax sp.]
GISIADRPHFQRLRDDPKIQVLFSEAQIARTIGQWSMVMARALRDDSGRFLGMAAAVIGLDGIGTVLGKVDVGAGGGILLRSSETFKLMLRRPLHNEKDFNQPLPKNNAIRQRIEAGERAGTLSFTASTDGVERLASFRVMDAYPFYVQVGLAKTDYLAAWRQDAAAVAGLAAVLLLGFVLVYLRGQKNADVLAAATRQLAYRQALFVGLFEQSGFLAGILDASGHLLEVNQAALAMIDRHRDEVIGQNFADMPWWSRAEDRAALQATLQAAAQGTPGSFEAQHPGPGGADITVLFHAVPVQAGPERYIAVTGIDISAIKAAEQQLVAQSQRLANILWGTGVGTWEWNVQTGETRFNQRWAEMMGYTLDELAPVSIATWMKLTHPDDLAASDAALQKHFAGERDHYECESRMRHKDGHWIWVLDRGRVNTWSADGKPLWMAGTHWEITERKVAEEAWRHGELRLKEAQRMAMIGHWELDLVSGRLTWSEQIFRIFEIDSQQFGASYEAFLAAIHPQDRDAVNAAYLRSLQTREPYSIEHRLLFADGRIKQVQEQCETSFDASGRPLRSIGTVQDITERKQTEQVLLQQTEALARSNAELEQFAFVVSHDLRQPLRMVNSYLQLLERALASQLDDNTREMMHYATDGAKRMDQMLMSLLEYSRVGRKGEPLLPLASREAVDEALRFLAPAIHEAQATVRLSGDWPQVIASPDEFTRLWQNLIGNAVKYRAPDRAPQIDITVAPQGDGWRFCIADNGIGIDPAQFDRLFKVFQRL